MSAEIVAEKFLFAVCFTFLVYRQKRFSLLLVCFLFLWQSIPLVPLDWIGVTAIQSWMRSFDVWDFLAQLFELDPGFEHSVFRIFLNFLVASFVSLAIWFENGRSFVILIFFGWFVWESKDFFFAQAASEFLKFFRKKLGWIGRLL